MGLKLSLSDKNPYFLIVLLTFFGRLTGDPYGRGGIIGSLVIFLFFLLCEREFFKVWLSCKVLLLYQIVCLSTIIFYSFNLRPISLYFVGVSTVLIPTFFYVFGKYDALVLCDEEVAERHKKFVMTNLFIILSGLMIMLFFSTVYFGYFSGVEQLSYSEWNFRFGSFIGSIQLGFLVPISIVLLFNSKDKFGKITTWFAFAILTLCAVITMQRASWVLTIVAIVMCYLTDGDGSEGQYQKKMVNLFKIVLVICCVVILIASMFDQLPDTMQRYWTYRFIQLQELTVYEERFNQVQRAFDEFMNHPLGIGLGAGGIKAFQYGYTVVGDNNFMTILVETGIFGIISFVLLIVSSLFQSFRYNKKFLFVAIVCMIVAGTGNSVFESFPGAYLFWWILGYTSVPVDCLGVYSYSKSGEY